MKEVKEILSDAQEKMDMACMYLEDALAHLVDMDTTREIGTVIREY